MPDQIDNRVVVFGLGGTIAMNAASTGGVTPSLAASDLVASVPGLADTGITVEVIDFRRIPGASLDFADIADLAAAIDRAVIDGASGIVITQGTDTIEETAYLLDLSYLHRQPVIITGAMRNPTMAGADGPANLLAAIQGAASDDLRDLGILVVINDEIHAARRVRKTHTTACATFQSPNGGPLGYVVEGVPRILNRPAPRLLVPRPVAGVEPKIALHTITFGDDGGLLTDIADRVDGLVVAAMGVGHVPARLVELLAHAATRIPVVLTSRIGAGSGLTSTYGFAGSERDLIAHGLVPAGFLDPLKARLLLHAMLGANADQAAIISGFAVAGGRSSHREWPWHVINEVNFAAEAQHAKS